MKVLFIDEVHSILWEGLQNKGYECVSGSHLNKSEIIKIIPDFKGIVIRSRLKIDKNFLNYCKKLKFIARSGSGVENIDTEYALKMNIKCLNAPEGNATSVAEHTLGMLLSLLNNLNIVDKEIREGIWRREKNRGYEISNKTIGIIGYGHCGTAFAKLLQGFDCSVIAYDKYLSSFQTNWAKKVEKKEIFEKSDIISFHIPLTQETKYLFNDEFLNNFKKPIYFINTSRGHCVKTSSILKGLNNKRLLGACLDVFEFEKKSFESCNIKTEVLQNLISSNKIILSPHIAGWSFESYKKLSEILLQKILMIRDD